jgi:hypothetical protein
MSREARVRSPGLLLGVGPSLEVLGLLIGELLQVFEPLGSEILERHGGMEGEGQPGRAQGVAQDLLSRGVRGARSI